MKQNKGLKKNKKNNSFKSLISILIV